MFACKVLNFLQKANFPGSINVSMEKRFSAFLGFYKPCHSPGEVTRVFGTNYLCISNGFKGPGSAQGCGASCLYCCKDVPSGVQMPFLITSVLGSGQEFSHSTLFYIENVINQCKKI